MENRIEHLETQVIRADYDDLSGVLKRKAFLDRGEKVLQLARQYQMACVVGFADLDNFKSINDQHGHDSGDRALTAFALALKNLIGNRGIAGRCGGDEFLFIIIYPATATREQVEAEITRGLAGVSIAEAGQTIPVAASIGLAWLGQAEAAQTIQHAVQRADELMYRAKQSSKGPLILSPRAHNHSRLAS
jgi:diguanylate cyclase (GGDEF)-like protein